MIDPAQSVSEVTAAALSASTPYLARSGASFSHVLEQATQGERREAARQVAAQLVSSAFIVPVLASLRESPFQEPPFAPNFAERRFAPLLDEQIADRITQASNFPLVDVIVDRLMGPAEVSEGANP